MADVAVTVPRDQWAKWIAEGDLPGEPWSGRDSYFSAGVKPRIAPGERVYVIAGGRLRGYAPLVRVERSEGRRVYLVRAGDAVAVTTYDQIPGFRGWRYRWWPREDERPFPKWREL